MIIRANWATQACTEPAEVMENEWLKKKYAQFT